MIDFPANAHALIIGVGEYAHSKYADLPATVSDAHAIAGVLTDKDRCGYPQENVRVLVRKDATSINICEALKALSQSTKPSSTVFIYFSGHGGRLLNGRGSRSYLCTHETVPDDLIGTAVSGGKFSDMIAAIPAQKVVVMLDACHASGLAAFKSVSGIIPWEVGLQDDYYEALCQGTGRVIIASSSSDQYSFVREQGDLSLFTWYLLEALGGKAAVRGDGLIHILDIFHYVSETVRAAKPKQTPILKVKDLDLNFPVALCHGSKSIASSMAAPHVANIREAIVKDAIHGAKLLSDYLKSEPKLASRGIEVDLKRTELKHIQRDLELFGQSDNDRVARNRIVFFLLSVCLELEET